MKVSIEAQLKFSWGGGLTGLKEETFAQRHMDIFLMLHYAAT